MARRLGDVRGADHNSIGKYEAGGREPSAAFVAAAAKLAKINGHWLLTGEGDPKPVPPTKAQEVLARIGREIDEARAMGSIPPDLYTPLPRESDED